MNLICYICCAFLLASCISCSSEDEQRLRRFSFDCGNEKSVPIIYKCDGDNDCGNGADEQDCSLSAIFTQRMENLQLFASLRPFDCGNGETVRQLAVCNNVNDCSNGADERNCENDMFDCGNERTVPNRYLCDGDDDCRNGADEQNCTNTPRRISLTPCSLSRLLGHPMQHLGDRFDCGNGRTVPTRYRCDRDDDCGNGADEQNCTRISHSVLSSTSFDCGNGRIVPTRYRCDRDDDCGNGADEQNCPRIDHLTPGSDFFDCGNGKTVPIRYKCDRDDDCGNGADERNCSRSIVHHDFSTGFDCGNGKIVLNYYICDNVDDCGNGADEQNCTRSATRPPSISPRFDCGDGITFIHPVFMCDGINHCPDGADERNCSHVRLDCGNGRTVDKNYICDRDDDCGNAVDERDCPSASCDERLQTGLFRRRIFSYSQSSQDRLGNDQECQWSIYQLRRNLKIELQFLEFQVGTKSTEESVVVEIELGTENCDGKPTGDCIQYRSNPASCPNDYVEIFDGTDASSSRLWIFCGDSIPPNVTSSGGNLFLRVHGGQTDQPVRFLARYY